MHHNAGNPLASSPEARHACAHYALSRFHLERRCSLLVAEMPRLVRTMMRVRFYVRDGSVFLGDHYLVRGVAGAIFWRLLCAYRTEGRREFSNRELRLDSRIPLPEIRDNLEARIALLIRRIGEKAQGITIEKCGRGRYRFEVDHDLELLEVGADGQIVTIA